MDIPTRNRTDLKSYFVKNAIPTESNFAELIDAVLNQSDDGIVKLPGSPLSIEAVGDNSSPKNTLNIYNTFGDENPAWTLNLNPRSNPADASTARQGLNIKDGEGNSRLFINRTDGNVGIGTTAPQATLDIGGGALLGYATPISDLGGILKSGFYQATGEVVGDVPDTSHTWTHLITARHSNTGNNHQLQISGSYAENDRLFFRKIAGPLAAKNPAWNEIATREVNTFSGNQIILNGNVGIGTPAPAARLSFNNVTDGSEPVGITWHNPSPTAYGLHRTAGAWTAPDYQQLRLGWSTGIILDGGTAYGKSYVDIQGNGLRVTSGNVGIGAATAPAEPLDVNGRIKAGALSIGPWPANAGYMFFGTNALNQAEAGNYALLQDASVGGVGTTFLNSPVRINFRISNADKMTLLNNGNVGIGTTNPAAKLVVNGVEPGERGFEVLGTVGNSHIPWTNGSVYLTGNIAGTAQGDFIFRTYNGSAYTQRFHINGADGAATVDILQLGNKWRMSAVGDAHGNDGWLRFFNKANTDYYGGIAAGRVYASTGRIEGSDSRRKENIADLENSLQKITRLKGVSFNWRGDDAGLGEQIGLVAQQVEPVFPELVEDGPDGMKALNYIGLIAPLIEAIKEQQTKIENLEEDVRSLQVK